ncbi:hypothetical protein EJ05DRAFT_488093 [Pseudovirgaria hyperparasitica]|uniref:CTLH domain-containing protein n=1 Tax=Pseudovirgaria hyperparasitica TaxID=470096 RepID=A0A6A6VZZ1_9PEZI|nr:uncharacterized protein EJ05DRAFT_488093 [Pseudovirgaria hyperparasitica]KAF2755304.1 hypothetical protein EJ05DRAFT_488093 [Pseudovirgaria hyperparasitica]
MQQFVNAAQSSSTVSGGDHVRHPFETRVENVKPSKTDINHVILDYLINEGYPSAAENFAKEANIQEANTQPPTEEDSLRARVEIRYAIYHGDIESAIKKINEFNTEILDKDPALHFALLRLQLIGLIRTCTATPNADIMPAIEFASSELAPRAPTKSEFLDDLEQTMALLIFPKGDLSEELNRLLEPGMRQDVATMVNEAILASHGARREARIRNLVKLRAWAETTAREEKKEIPSRIPLGLDTEDAENGDEDESMNGAGDGDAMVT